MNRVVNVNADFCESCENSFLGLTGSTKWCPYCGAKHEGATVPYTFPAAKWTDFDRTEKNNPPFGKEVLVKYSACWPNDEKVFITGGTLYSSDNNPFPVWYNGRGEVMRGVVHSWCNVEDLIV